jgi:hypothetical protein
MMLKGIALCAVVLSCGTWGGIAHAKTFPECARVYSLASDDTREEAVAKCLAEPSGPPPSARRLSDKEAAAFARTAKAAAVAQLKDPQSAQFRDLYVSDSIGIGDDGKDINVRTWYLCGQINAKNSYGGYTGFQRFAATPGGAIFEGTEKSDAEAFDAVVAPKCNMKARSVK